MSEKTEMNLFMGPQHPSMHGLWAMRLTIDGETVLNADAQLGYLHRGYEKLLQNRQYHQGIPIADRLCYVESMNYSMPYAWAAEGVFGVEAPEKANAIRILTHEIQRLASHCLWLAAMAADLGQLTMLIYPMNAREYLLKLLELITGARMTYNYARIGGVAQDLPPGFGSALEQTLEDFQHKHGEFLDMLDESQVWRMRTEGVGVMTKEQAIEWGVTGPVLRASGVAYDIRKIDPYWGFERMKFKVITRNTGDSYARYRLRLDEMQESIKIVYQALDWYHEFRDSDPVNIEKIPRRPEKGKKVYRRIEAGRGEAGFYLESDGTPQPRRVRIQSPTFQNLYVLPKLIKYQKLADIPAIMGTIDICVGDLDR